MRVSANGQVTIPQEIREQLGIEPGTEVDFAVEGDDLVMRKCNHQTSGQILLESLRDLPKPTMSSQEFLALTRGDD